MTIISLSPAYVWDCEQCGRENFQRAVSVRLDPDDEADADVIRTMEGMPPGVPIPEGVGGCMMTRPERVTCRHCRTEFKAVDSGQEDFNPLED